MKKRIVLITVSILFVLILGYLSYEAYLFHNPNITVNVAVADSEDFHSEMPHLVFGRESIFGYAENTKKEIQRWEEMYLELTMLNAEAGRPSYSTVTVTKDRNEIVVTFRINDTEKVYSYDFSS